MWKAGKMQLPGAAAPSDAAEAAKESTENESTADPEPSTGEQTEGESGAFIAAETFDGAKPGYAFKQGPQGLGYYQDA